MDYHTILKLCLAFGDELFGPSWDSKDKNEPKPIGSTEMDVLFQ
uniref:Uncharacterized protein n=1 Tax=Vitis vinifera TaxID=29760 RepID=F6H5E4_VITVI